MSIFWILARTKRVGITQSACGVCGRDNIDDLLERIPVLESTERIEVDLLKRVPAMLAVKQDNFARTGGLHAACAIAATGRVLAHAEDVGRHNAVDKVVGKLFHARNLPRHNETNDPARILAVSGRASFEIRARDGDASVSVLKDRQREEVLGEPRIAFVNIAQKSPYAGFVREPDLRSPVREGTVTGWQCLTVGYNI